MRTRASSWDVSAVNMLGRLELSAWEAWREGHSGEDLATRDIPGVSSRALAEGQ